MESTTVRIEHMLLFLETIHEFNDPGTLYLARTDGSSWIEQGFVNTPTLGITGPVEDFMLAALEDKDDLYFSVRTFDGPRKNETATLTRLLYADIDHSRRLGAEPWLRWITSRGSTQGIWLVDEYLDQEEHPAFNRALTYAIGADKGGWAGSKLLRMPWSWSAKRQTWVGPPSVNRGGRVDLSLLEPKPPKDFSQHEKIHQEITYDEWAQLLHDEYNNVPNHIMSELLSPTTDRSMKIWMVSRMMRDAGVPVDKAVALISGTQWNKWRGDVKKLARDVYKAYGL